MNNWKVFGVVFTIAFSSYSFSQSITRVRYVNSPTGLIEFANRFPDKRSKILEFMSKDYPIYMDFIKIGNDLITVGINNLDSSVLFISVYQFESKQR